MRRSKIEILDQYDICQIIEAAYDLLENFSVQVENQEVLQTLTDGGAKVDFKQKIAFIPPVMVDKALETVPSSFSVYDQTCKNKAALITTLSKRW
ncbi:MAG: trimethylamine methyltransferase family protein [Candidatus Hodarchaeota archaeon]